MNISELKYMDIEVYKLYLERRNENDLIELLDDACVVENKDDQGTDPETSYSSDGDQYLPQSLGLGYKRYPKIVDILI